MTEGKMLLVGEANPRSADPLHALWPTPNSAGGRLCKMLGMTRWGYLHRFDRVNLFVRPPLKWNKVLASVAASDVLRQHDNDHLVLLGNHVAEAFGVSDFRLWCWTHVHDRWILRLPHPSGRCRTWNSPTNVTRLPALLDVGATDEAIRAALADDMDPH